MRAATALLLAVLLAGCAAEAPRSPTASPTPPGQGESSVDPDTGGLVAPRPTHPLGRAWTYEGDELYNEDAQFTVVVARADPAGYLFAGGAEDDLVYSALWVSPWLGEVDLDGDPSWGNRLQFPITDGASWALNERISVAAREADVATPSGTERGFVIEGADDRSRVSYDYAPSLGVVTRYEYGPVDGDTWDAIRLTGVASNVSWIWYERGDLVAVGNAHEPQTFDVGDGFDAVIASAGGRDGSRALVAPPGGAQAWSEEFGGEEDWRHAIFAPTAGTWSAEVFGRPFVEGAPELPAEPPVGWVYMHVAPIKWLRGQP